MSLNTAHSGCLLTSFKFYPANQKPSNALCSIYCVRCTKQIQVAIYFRAYVQWPSLLLSLYSCRSLPCMSFHRNTVLSVSLSLCVYVLCIVLFGLLAFHREGGAMAWYALLLRSAAASHSSHLFF